MVECHIWKVLLVISDWLWCGGVRGRRGCRVGRPRIIHTIFALMRNKVHWSPFCSHFHLVFWWACCCVATVTCQQQSAGREGGRWLPYWGQWRTPARHETGRRPSDCLPVRVCLCNMKEVAQSQLICDAQGGSLQWTLCLTFQHLILLMG